MEYSVTTAPTKEPVSLEEAKLWLKVDGDDDDDLIESLIAVARDYCQQYEGRAYVEQTITAFCNHFRRRVFLPVAPVLDITTIHYRDTVGNWQLVPEDYWTLRNDVEPGYVEFNMTGLSYQLSFMPNRIRIVFTAGYTYLDEATWKGTVPERVKAAMCLLLGHWYEHRVATCEAALKEIPIGVKSLLSERVWQNAD